jgi:DNA-binding MarR family transcriptional regulator
MHIVAMQTDDRTANLLGALALALADRMTAGFADADAAGPSRAAALLTLASFPGPSIEGLRCTLGLTHSATVRLVDGLAADGHVERKPAADRRAVSLRLTAAGKRAAAGLAAARRHPLASALGTLRPAERRALEPLVERLLAALTDGRERADRICRLCEIACCPQERCPVERRARQVEAG